MREVHDSRFGATRQLDGLRKLSAALGNDDARLWSMCNGYALCTREGLEEIDRRIAGADAAQVDAWRDLLRIGIHSDVEVTDAPGSPGLPRPTVSQAFCSALPVRYTQIDSRHWRAFATLVLEGAYEATLRTAVLNAARGASSLVFLTRLGGGAFGNDEDWIHAAMRRAVPGRRVRARPAAGELRRRARGVASACCRVSMKTRSRKHD